MPDAGDSFLLCMKASIIVFEKQRLRKPSGANREVEAAEPRHFCALPGMDS
jgi:hypothetical protein